MSQENLEIVRRAFEATNRGQGPAVLLEFYDADVELDARGTDLGQLVGGDVYRGHEGVRHFFRRYYEAWEHVDYEIEELLDAGEHVVAVVNNRCRGRGSGITLEWQAPSMWTIRGGKIIRLVFFMSRDEPSPARTARRRR
jgi:ketosteroid isomerase-like protein